MILADVEFTNIPHGYIMAAGAVGFVIIYIIVIRLFKKSEEQSKKK